MPYLLRAEGHIYSLKPLYGNYIELIFILITIRRWNVFRISAIFLLIPTSICLAVDLQPNDIVAPLPGKNHAMLSYVNVAGGTYYRNGSAVSSRPFGSPDISIQSAVARLSTSYSITNLPGISYIQLPYGTIKPAGSLAPSPESTGIGDLTFATAIWPYADRESRKYFGIAAYLAVPTGSYNSQQAFNFGENRYQSDIQMGYQQPIIGNLDGMVAVGTMWFGGNSQCAAACLSASNASLNQNL